MNLNIHEQLDPVFETLGLLYVSSHMVHHRQHMIDELGQFGVDGEAFYTKHLKTVDKYLNTFRKHRVDNESDSFFFKDEDPTFFTLLLRLLCENRSWLSSLETAAEDQIRQELLKVLFDVQKKEEDNPGDAVLAEIRTLEDIIAFLGGCSYEEGMKWKLMALLQHPHKQVGALIAAVNNNVHAFEQAKQVVEKPLGRLISAYVQSIRSNGDQTFMKVVEIYAHDASVYPALIMPLGQSIYTTQGYYGLFVDCLPLNGKNPADSREHLLLRLKALADNSKLQILASLKLSPKYNLEIAEHLGLSAATVSHHMNVLLTCGMVSIDKQNGKVYYHLDTANLELLIKELERYLL